jgi:class 3 adenylate cyclase
VLVTGAVAGTVMCVAVGVIAGASDSRLIQYGIIGLTFFTVVQMIAMHSIVEAFMRPARVAIAADSGIGDALPRSRPGFATWSILSVVSTAWTFSLGAAILAVANDRVRDDPGLAVVIATGLTLVFAVPITVGALFAPSLRPIRDLAEGTERVAAGDYSQRLPVVQDDDLGALAGSFNRMQDGLAERERLQSAFGSYVDPALAARLLEQGDDIFTGERIAVTVMFVDIRDFTPFAEANTAEDTVSHLNALFEIVVPAVIDAGGHVNKYLGDGALAVFGAPNSLDQHADAAITAALRISQRVNEHFQGALRIGVGINTGKVIAGTIGGAGKLEFTLIGDTVNVAARVEQLTKVTGDTILLTQDTLDALSRPPAGLIDRGSHDLKGKAASTHVHALEPVS